MNSVDLRGFAWTLAAAERMRQHEAERAASRLAAVEHARRELQADIQGSESARNEQLQFLAGRPSSPVDPARQQHTLRYLAQALGRERQRQQQELMLYAIIARDVPNSIALRPSVRPRHLSYLQPLIDQGRVVFAGPHPAIDSPDPGPAGFTGSLIIAEFDSLEGARAWSSRDPYVLEGVFGEVEIKPVLQVHP